MAQRNRLPSANVRWSTDNLRLYLRKFIYRPVLVASIQNYYAREATAWVGVFRGTDQQYHRELVTTPAELPAMRDLISGSSGAREKVLESIARNFLFGMAGEQNHTRFDIPGLPGLKETIGGSQGGGVVHRHLRRR